MNNFKIHQRNSLVNKIKPQRDKKHKITIFILSLICIICLFILAMPYLPRLYYLVKKPKIDSTEYIQAVKDTKEGNTTKIGGEALKGNRLILPDIGVNTEVIDGKDIYVIGKNQGVWRETPKINPTIDGNLVIAGHRFLYTAKNGGWFYNLTELRIGQRIFMKWENKVFEYEVTNTKTVLPTQVDIRDNDPSISRKLTLYTCYPLGSTAKRFVVEAKQI